ncbi:DapH/DapD/GlmU-related protein [Anaerofustis stercorihominis]|uniref:DapH/DapD/GlmU-related protein n=1 Tax=Anaerofustis stercorihominis TaxID=214853 RepID=UPI003984045A
MKKYVFKMLRNAERVDLHADYFKPAVDEMMRTRCLCFDVNNIRPDGDINSIFEEIFNDSMDTKRILTPFQLDFGNQTKLGKGVFINHSFVGSAAGGIIIDDDVQIAPKVTILTVNHDHYERNICICKTVHIKKGAWIGSESTILPGVTIGENAIVGAGSVVTKDVPDNCVVVGNPAKIIKKLD